MNVEIITSRWLCPECGGPLRLLFSQSGSTDDEASDEFVCDRVFCHLGHQVPDELTQEIIAQADLEFYAAMERGYMAAQVWVAPPHEELENEVPPETELGNAS